MLSLRLNQRKYKISIERKKIKSINLKANYQNFKKKLDCMEQKLIFIKENQLLLTKK